MADNVIDNIRRRQEIISETRYAPPLHRPEMIYYGCMDARLDPITQIGIPQGKALIVRNPGGIIHKPEINGKPLDAKMAAELANNGVIPHEVDLYAALEFYKSLPQEDTKNPKPLNVVVAAHTDCGALKACRDHNTNAETNPNLWLYLEGSLGEVRARVAKKAEANHWDKEQFLHGLEEESVRQSIKNLLSFPPLKESVDRGEIKLYGWVLDTATGKIRELNQQTQEFEPMGKKRAPGISR